MNLARGVVNFKRALAQQIEADHRVDADREGFLKEG